MVDDNPASKLNAMPPGPACMVFPWFFAIGFLLGFIALFAKSYRIMLLFHNSSLKRRIISAKPALASVAVVILAEIIILIAWTADAPLIWVRTVLENDTYGHPLESTAACEASNPRSIGYIGTITALHIVALGFGAYVSGAIRDIPMQFQDGRWIALALGTTLQIFLIGVPTVVAVYTTSPFARYICMALIVFVTNSALSGFIIIPKMHGVHTDWDGEITNSSQKRTAPETPNQSIRVGKEFISNTPNSAVVVSGNLT